MEERNWEVVEEAPNIIQAEIIRGLLEAQGLSVLISREGYQSAIGISGPPAAFIEILVPNDQVKEAKKILNDYYSGNLNNAS